MHIALGVVVAGFSVACAFVTSAVAQEYPSKPIRIIVPIAPGAVPDLVARIVAASMAKTLGQSVIAENRPGAGGLLAFEYVAKQAAPDGYTIGLANQPLATAHVFVKDLKCDPLKDLRPITKLMDGVLMIGTRADAPWKNFQEMIAYAKANPGKLNYGSAGVQTSGALYMEAVKQKNGVDIVNIPYQGGTAQTRPALLEGSIQFSIYTEGMAASDGNRVRMLMTTGDRRVPNFPDVPTLKELGQAEIPNTWFALVAPAATPGPVIDKLHGAAKTALQSTDIVGWMDKNRLYPVGSTPDETHKSIAREMAIFSEIAQKAGVKPQ